MAATTCIQRGTVLLPDREVDCGTVVISDRRISYAGKRLPTPRGAREIDAEGCVVSPGLMDVHIHGIGDIAFERLDPDRLAEAARRLAALGVLRFVPTMMADLEAVSAAAGAIMKSGLRGVCPGIYVEGPFVSMRKRGGILPRYVRPVDHAHLRRLLRAGRGLIRMMTFAPELDGSAGLAAALRRAGVLPCVGHTDADVSETKAAAGRGPLSFTHLFNAMSGLDHRRPGAAAFALEARDAWVELNPDGIHVAPEMVRLASRLVPRDRMVLITDAVISAGSPDGRYTYMGRGIVASPRGVHYEEDGTLIGSRILLNEGVVRYAEAAGVPLHEAVRAASLNPAGLLGLAARTGSLERGKLADLVIFAPGLERAAAAFRAGKPLA